MKSKKVIVGIVLGCCVCAGYIAYYCNKPSGNKFELNENQLQSVEVSGKNQIKADITLIKDLKSLKSQSDLIVEVERTDDQEKRDYKGIPSIVTTVKVNEVFKGDKSLKYVKVIQTENRDIAPKNNQRLLMFLMKGNGTDNPDCYGVVGAGQGIYIIEKSSTSQSYVLKAQAIENKEVLKELTGNYNELKNKLK